MKQALLLIDIQEAFKHPSWGERNQPQAEEKMQRLLQHFRKNNQPVLHVQHISSHPESLFHLNTGQAFQAGFEPIQGEPVFRKTVNSAFIGTNLAEYLHTHAIDTLNIIGLTLPHCVSTTTRMAANLGFAVNLIEDATATFALHDHHGKLASPQDLHYHHLVALNQEFAQIRRSEDIIHAV